MTAAFAAATCSESRVDHRRCQPTSDAAGQLNGPPASSELVAGQLAEPLDSLHARAGPGG
jgi:hypothetical protein